MNKTSILFNFSISLFLLFSIGCKHEYQKMVDQELASGERYDSIFLNMHLGMDKKDFFDLCWKMNKEGLVKQGDKNTSVQFKMDMYGNDVKVESLHI